LTRSLPIAEAVTTAQAFLQAFHDLGHVDGRTIAIEYRWAEGREEQLPVLAAELVTRNPDVIYAWNTLAARAAKEATAAIPIVFGAANDPVEAGLVASLAHPGGNVTGPSVTNSGLSAKSTWSCSRRRSPASRAWPSWRMRPARPRSAIGPRRGRRRPSWAWPCDATT
jgi:hypothetical protein